jgi:putative adenylate-forming enzyme
MRRALADGLETLLSFARCRYARPPASRAALERTQQQQVVRHLRHVLPHSPYYRELFARVGGDARRWRELAISDKAALMAQFSRVNTAGIDRDRALALALEADRSRDFAPKLAGLTVGLSSGTSGQRGLFLASQSENNRWAGVALAKMLPGQLWDTHRIALLHRANSHLYQGLGSGRLQFRHFDLLQPWTQLLAAVQRYRPTVLIAPPSALRLLAEARAQGALALPTPRRLVSVAEVLEPADRVSIERAFGVRVDIAYVATEGFIASTCAHGGLHLNEDLLVVEKNWLGDSRRVFTPIITDFHRRVVPIIRYRLDDVLSLAEAPCACGSSHTTLAAIQGRHDDLFRFGERAVFPDFIRSAVMQSSPDILDYEVVQTAPDVVEARLAVADAALSRVDAISAALRGELARISAALAAPAPSLVVKLAPARPRALTAAKVRRVRSELRALT